MFITWASEIKDRVTITFINNFSFISTYKHNVEFKDSKQTKPIEGSHSPGIFEQLFL